VSTFQKIAADAAVKLRSAAARSCAARSVVETVNMMHNSSQNLLETLLSSFSGFSDMMCQITYPRIRKCSRSKSSSRGRGAPVLGPVLGVGAKETPRLKSLGAAGLVTEKYLVIFSIINKVIGDVLGGVSTDENLKVSQ
jgi:hypothetical protein